MARILLSCCGAASLFVLSYSASAFAADCFIDSNGGNDSSSGLSEDQPVKSQSAIPSSCTVAKFKRGSDFAGELTIAQGVKTYTNYGEPCDPLPKFHRQRSPNNGSIVSAYQGGITIDGLYLAGSMSDESMSNLMNGVCVMVGGGSKILNSEITNCDIGIMLMGEGSLVQGNYIHDLYVSVDAAPGVDPNAVGGAEGIFINGSNNEIAYNSFVRCSNTAEWTGGSCDGGATEVTVGAGDVLSGVKVHHNFAYLSCGFFEVSSMQGAKGTFANSSFYHNVSVDSGWLMLLQVNNTNLENIRWENNTVVHRAATSINPGMLVTVFTGTSSGVSGGSLAPNSVFLTNDLFILDGFDQGGFVSELDSNLVLTNTVVIKSPGENAGVVNIAGAQAEDFDLVEGSPAIDQGAATTNTVDFLNRTAPAGGAMDIGAFEFGASLASGMATPVTADIAVPGCADPNATGGAGGASPTATGGTGTTPTSTGGQAPASSGGTGTTPSGSGGSSGVTTTTTVMTCAASLTLCNSLCFDLMSNANHCGACGKACGVGELCSGGVCTSACGAELTPCGQSCVNLNADILNCGTCGYSCMIGQTCVAGSCVGTPTGGVVSQPVVTTGTPEEGTTTTAEGESEPEGLDDSIGAENPAGCTCATVGNTTRRTPASLLLLLAMTRSLLGCARLARRRTRSTAR